MGSVLKLDGVILEYENSTVFGFLRTKALKALGAGGNKGSAAAWPCSASDQSMGLLCEIQEPLPSC